MQVKIGCKVSDEDGGIWDRDATKKEERRNETNAEDERRRKGKSRESWRKDRSMGHARDYYRQMRKREEKGDGLGRRTMRKEVE